MKLYVKNMVNVHCRKAVKNELKNFGAHYVISDSGIVDVMEDLTREQHKQLKVTLANSGMELMDNEKVNLIEKIKNLVIGLIHIQDESSERIPSEYLSKKLNCKYHLLAEIFAEGMGISIENFMISQKIEHVKELIIYNELSLKEIAWKMNYLNVERLSGHFKTVTGLSLSHFKKIYLNRHNLIDDA